MPQQLILIGCLSAAGLVVAELPQSPPSSSVGSCGAVEGGAVGRSELPQLAWATGASR